MRIIATSAVLCGISLSPSTDREWGADRPAAVRREGNRIVGIRRGWRLCAAQHRVRWGGSFVA